jgi:hypothetical protein
MGLACCDHAGDAASMRTIVIPESSRIQHFRRISSRRYYKAAA